MIHRAGCGIVLLLFAAAPAAAEQAPKRESSRFIAGAVVSMASVRTDADAAEWRKSLQRYGLVENDGLWTLRDALGEDRVQPFFLRDDTSFWVFFFPADDRAIPDALLLALSSKAAAVRLQDGDRLEIDFPSETSLHDGRMRSIARSMLVSLPGGTLVRTLVVVEWKNK